ncbi:MAG: DUF4112 domain-containing protein [Thiohalobacteraceae bacterium]
MVMQARMGKLPLELPLGSDPEAVRRRVELLERVLERSVRLPVVGNVGLDAVLGLVPVAGDAVGGLIGLYLVWEARNLGLSRWQQARMLARVGVDTAVGSIPLAGDVIDVFYRANSRNLRTIRRHLDQHYPKTRIIDLS